MNSAVPAARTGVVAATYTVFVLISTELGLFLNFVVEKRVLIDERCSHERSTLDVDMPAGQARSEACILTLLADGKRELVVGDDDGCIVVLLVDCDRVDPRR